MQNRLLYFSSELNTSKLKYCASFCMSFLFSFETQFSFGLTSESSINYAVSTLHKLENIHNYLLSTASALHNYIPFAIDLKTLKNFYFKHYKR